MNRDNIKLIASATASAVVVVAAVTSSIRVRREEQQKRLEIERNKQLDLEAIRRAGAIEREWLDNADISEVLNLQNVMDRLHNQIAFQKIAIREDH